MKASENQCKLAEVGERKATPVKHFLPDDWHTVTPRIITPKPEEMIRFVKEVFRGQGEFHVNRPSEIRIGDSSKREQKHLSFRPINRMATGGRWWRTHGAICGRLLRTCNASNAGALFGQAVWCTHGAQRSRRH